jgi:hypothetical protein
MLIKILSLSNQPECGKAAPGGLGGYPQMKVIFIFITLMLSIALAGDIDGSFTTGIFTGTPFWNPANYSDDNTIDSESSFLRTYNRLRVNGNLSNQLGFKINALRSDNFESENHLSKTKIYQVLLDYRFSKGTLSAGRFMPFSRWIYGSIDGGALAYHINRQISVNVYGGILRQYGRVLDTENTLNLGYADIGYRFKQNRIKVKMLSTEENNRSGIDFYSSYKTMQISGNYGYDITNKRIADGGLALFMPVNSAISVSGSYRLFRTDDFKINRIDFSGYLIERFIAGIKYELFKNHYLDFRQMLSMTSEFNDYLSVLNFIGRQYNIGINYLDGDSQLKRIGIQLGGHYELTETLRLAAGISPVSYMYDYQDEYQRTIAYYLRANYKVIKHVSLAVTINYYDSLKALHDNIRGGLQLTYNFGSN